MLVCRVLYTCCTSSVSRGNRATCVNLCTGEHDRWLDFGFAVSNALGPAFMHLRGVLYLFADLTGAPSPFRYLNGRTLARDLSFGIEQGGGRGRSLPGCIKRVPLAAPCHVFQQNVDIHILTPAPGGSPHSEAVFAVVAT